MRENRPCAMRARLGGGRSAWTCRLFEGKRLAGCALEQRWLGWSARQTVLSLKNLSEPSKAWSFGLEESLGPHRTSSSCASDSCPARSEGTLSTQRQFFPLSCTL